MQERPSDRPDPASPASSEFEQGNAEEALKEIGLSEGRIFDKGLLDRAEQELKRQSLTRGRYATNVSTTVTPLERNRVARELHDRGRRG